MSMMESVFHNNPNPFTGNAPGMGFKVMYPQQGQVPMDRFSMLESRIGELERMLGVGNESDMMGVGDSLSDMLFRMV